MRRFSAPSMAGSRAWADRSSLPGMVATSFHCSELQWSARKHGVGTAAIVLGVDRPLAVVDLEPDADPLRVPAIGPGGGRPHRSRIAPNRTAVGATEPRPPEPSPSV